MNDYSFDLINDIKFCNKKIAETKLAIQNIEAKPKPSMEREEFSVIEKIFRENKEAIMCLLQKIKFKLSNHLKNNPKPGKKRHMLRHV